MPKKPIKNNSSPVIFFTTIKKSFGTAHFLRVKYYQKFFPEKIIFAFDDSSDSQVKRIDYAKGLGKKQFNLREEIDLTKVVLFLKQVQPRLFIFDCRELEGKFFYDLFNAFPFSVKVIFDSQENFLTETATYLINPLPLVNYFPTNVYGLDYLYLSSFPSPIKQKENVVFYVGLIDNPHYLRKAFKEIKSFYLASPELAKASLIIIINNIQIPFLKVFVKTYLEGIRVLFQQRLSNFSSLVKLKPILFITHYGISLIEALKNQLPALVFYPTKYHKRLSEKHFSGLVYKSQLNFKEVLANSKKFFQTNTMGKKSDLVVRLLGKLNEFNPKTTCPVCSSKKIKICLRRSWFNLVKCFKCRLVFQENLGLKQIFKVASETYNKDYFFKQYQKQYGLSYLDDKSNINRLNNSRIKILSKYKPRGKVLDIGPALGFFLDLMQERGYETYASEISAYAKNYLKKRTRHKVIEKDFTQINFNQEKLKVKFDLITLWYVIEHFSDLEKLFQTIGYYQKKGGVLAFATPNGAGLTARLDRKKFLFDSPPDHYFIFSKKNIFYLLKKNGYKEVKVRSTGIHYSRFKKLFPLRNLGKFLIPHFLYNLLAKIFNLGDTFEVYAVKK